jgi:hypothetical protein
MHSKRTSNLIINYNYEYVRETHKIETYYKSVFILFLSEIILSVGCILRHPSY